MHMLAIYWEPKSAFQNVFCRYSTISKHNNSTTVKLSGHLSLRHSWAPVTVPEALPALRPGKMPVFFWYLSGICLVFVRDFAGILPVFVRNPVPGLYRTSPGAPDRTENTFYRRFFFKEVALIHVESGLNAVSHIYSRYELGGMTLFILSDITNRFMHEASIVYVNAWDV